jgi:hypothetical protein
MNTLDKYKQEVRTMFFISVDKDIELWSGRDCMRSPNYNMNKLDSSASFVYIKVKRDKSELIIENDYVDLTICKYKKSIFITDYKVYRYVNKLKKQIIKREKDKESEKEIRHIKNCLSSIQSFYNKEVRREKLNKIK